MIITKIQEEITLSMKARKKEHIKVLRFIFAFIQTYAKEHQTDIQELTDEEVITILSQLKKRSQDSIEQFTVGNRDDLVEQEQKYLDVIVRYLPKQLSQDNAKEIIQVLLLEKGFSNKKDFGKAMGTMMKEMKGKIDGKIVKQLVQEILV